MSTAFRFLVHARNKLYETGILPALRLDHPVVSVGNLTLGGTGKTPLVIALAQQFRRRGFQPVILSRGYGRKSRELLVASPESKWEKIGDEPYLMMRRLRDVPIVVGADRHQAGLLAERERLGNLFLLDDGFQHRRLYRDVDIVTIDPVEWAAGEKLLPVGRWREAKSAIARAHIACVQEQPSGMPFPSVPIPCFTVRTEVEGIYKEGQIVPMEMLRGRDVTAFAGIAKPDRFFASLHSMGIHPARVLRFPDHHRYSRHDVDNLQGEVLITTEKDSVRLQGSRIRDFLYLRISANIPEFDRLMDVIFSRLDKR